ncbi:MAG: tetraacyldisaccharide 4'-kinase [Proteobacteria bacterium]|nr:tetraacyldisaccharide 4'-kinase [Pseudomonadota bacterium]
MSNIFKKIESIMTSKNKAGLISFESFLFILSLIYGSAVKIRGFFYDKGLLWPKKLPCVVISIGNITVGGTGKTPMTIYVANLVKRMGYKVVVISRGYKGLAEKTGGIVSDGKRMFMKADKSGDEPFMIANRLKNTPVVVGKNRFKAGIMAFNSFNPDVIVLDDAYQHLKLKRDIDLVLLDNKYPFGNNHLLPRGTLREPISSLMRSDAIILTRSDSPSGMEEESSLAKFKKYTCGKPIFKAIHTPKIYKIIKAKNIISDKISTHSFDLMRGQKVFAFSGIARNSDFRHVVEGLNCKLKGFTEFPDHHLYSNDDLSNLLQLLNKLKVDFVLTTEKDYVKIADRVTWPVDLVVIGINISLGNYDNAFDNFLKNRLDELVK